MLKQCALLDAFFNEAEVNDVPLEAIGLVLVGLTPNVAVVAVFIDYVVRALISGNNDSAMLNNRSSHAFNKVF